MLYTCPALTPDRPEERQVELNTENTLNSELKSLSEKIRQYRSGEGVPDKPLYLTGMKGRVQLGSDGLEVIPNPNFEVAYNDAWDQALNIMRKFTDTNFTGLPDNKSEPMIGLRCLEEWCYTNSQKVEDEQHFNKPAEPEQNTTSAKEEKANINIQNFRGVLGDVQAANVQTGNHASIHEQPKAENKKGKVKAIVTIVSFLAALLTCIYLLWWLWTEFSP